ncbi:MAG: carboxypeptidase regulatory-like domain-containing protein [Planctomycetes bacterium]|nr:carboxypeptidase regulatory-like domain-containing protein [Planctomycetota bacterium]
MEPGDPEWPPRFADRAAVAAAWLLAFVFAACSRREAAPTSTAPTASASGTDTAQQPTEEEPQEPDAEEPDEPDVPPPPQQPLELRPGETEFENLDAFPGAEPKDADGDDWFWCVQIVDAMDLRPLPGASVQVPRSAGSGAVTSDLHFQCAAVTDEFGWARLPWPGVWGYHDYVFADAAGHVAEENCGPGEDRCELLSGADVPVQLVDYTGRPVPRGRIELVLGCGHVPCQRTAIADAEGRAVLHDIQPSRHEDLFVWAAGQQFGAYRLRTTWREGSAPVVIDCVPGVEVRGRVLDATGQPVAGVRVGAKGHARPWERTDAEGNFALQGLEAWSTIEVVPPPPLGLATETFPAPPPGVARTVVLGQPQDGAELLVHATGPDGAAADGVRVTAVRAHDGQTATAETDEHGDVRLPVAPGSYRVLADGHLGTWGRAESIADVTAAAEVTLRLTVPRNPTVRVDASRVLDMTVGITTATDYRALDAAGIDGADVPVPAGERATFRVSTWQDDDELGVRFFEVPAPGGVVVLEGPPPSHVKAHFVGPDGEPVEARLSLQRQAGEWRQNGDDETSTEADAATPLRGRCTWFAIPADDALAPRFGDLVLTDDDVDLGEVRFAQRNGPALRVEMPEELRDTQFRVRIAMPREHLRYDLDLDDETFTCDDVGTAAAGDIVQVSHWSGGDGDVVVPYTFELSGPPPWTVPWPRAELKVTARRSDGHLLTDGVVLLDGFVVPIDEDQPGSVRLRGIQAGPHTLVVAQREHLSRTFVLRFADGEQRSLDVRLSPKVR